jgi:hypothetical protein
MNAAFYKKDMKYATLLERESDATSTNRAFRPVSILIAVGATTSVPTTSIPDNLSCRDTPP